MFCPICGARLADGARFCPNCGTEMDPGKKKRPGALPWLIAAIVLLLALAGLLLWLVLRGRAAGETVRIGDEEITRAEIRQAAADCGISEDQVVAVLENQAAVDELIRSRPAPDSAMLGEEQLREEARRLEESLNAQGLIAPGSARYDPDSATLSFAFAAGGWGEVQLREPPAGELGGCFAGGSDSASAWAASVLPQALTARTGGRPLRVLLLYGVTHDPNAKAFMDLSLEMTSAWKEYGVNLTVDAEVTLDDLASLQGYDVTVFLIHGVESYADGSPYEQGTGLLLEQEVSLKTSMKNLRHNLRGNLAGHWVNNGSEYVNRIAVFPGFFTDSYPKGGLDGLFLANTCMFFGCDHRSTKADTRYADALIGCGADCVIGFHNSVQADYALGISEQVLCEMMEGSTASQALDRAIRVHGETDNEELKRPDHPFAAYPVIRGDKGYCLPDAVLPQAQTQGPASDLDAVNAYISFMAANPSFLTDLYPYGDRFIISAYALEDLSGDGIPELLLATSQDSYFSAEITGILVCTLDERMTVEPLFFTDTDTVYPYPQLANGRWMVTYGHGTGGYLESYYQTILNDSVIGARSIYWGLDSGGTTYYLDSRVEQDEFERYLLEVSGQSSPSLRDIIFFPPPEGGITPASSSDPYADFLANNRILQTDLYPWAAYFEVSSYARLDLDNDGVDELLLGTKQDSYFSSQEMTGFLVCFMKDGQLTPSFYFDTDTVYPYPDLCDHAWLVTYGHGTGGYLESRYYLLSLRYYRTARSVYPGIGEGETRYYEDDEEVPPEVFEIDLLSSSGHMAEGVSLEQIVFTPLDGGDSYPDLWIGTGVIHMWAPESWAGLFRTQVYSDMEYDVFYTPANGKGEKLLFSVEAGEASDFAQLSLDLYLNYGGADLTGQIVDGICFLRQLDDLVAYAFTLRPDELAAANPEGDPVFARMYRELPEVFATAEFYGVSP